MPKLHFLTRALILLVAAMLGSIYYSFNHETEHVPGFNRPLPQEQQQAAAVMPEPEPATEVQPQPQQAEAPVQPPATPVINMPPKIARIMTASDWRRVKTVLYEQHIEDMSQSVEWFDGRTLARGDIAWQSAELDKKGCRKFIVTRFADSRKEKNKTAIVALCPDGKIH